MLLKNKILKNLKKLYLHNNKKNRKVNQYRKWNKKKNKFINHNSIIKIFRKINKR
jgi:hypothetical protein